MWLVDATMAYSARLEALLCYTTYLAENKGCYEEAFDEAFEKVKGIIDEWGASLKQKKRRKKKKKK